MPDTEAAKARLEAQLAELEQRQERIADGTYGECVRCGEDIAPARLEARPEAALCIDCARSNERS